MAKKKSNRKGLISCNQTVADNRRAKFDYHIENKIEAGIQLLGTEVKSLRMGQCSINEAYVGPKKNEMWLINAHIPEYQQAARHLQHDPKRHRKLLLKKREIDKLMGAVSKDGYTLVPIRLYFNDKGIAKLEIGLGKGKQTRDKRETIKKRDWDRDKSRIMKNTNR
jgi:SsrA-binding protein